MTDSHRKHPVSKAFHKKKAAEIERIRAPLCSFTNGKTYQILDVLSIATSIALLSGDGDGDSQSIGGIVGLWYFC